MVVVAQVAAGGDLSPCYQATARVETLSGLSAPSCPAFHRVWHGAYLLANAELSASGPDAATQQAEPLQGRDADQRLVK